MEEGIQEEGVEKENKEGHEVEQTRAADLQAKVAQTDKEQSRHHRTEWTVINLGDKEVLDNILEDMEREEAETAWTAEKETETQQGEELVGGTERSRPGGKEAGQGEVIGLKGMATRASKRLCRDGTTVSQNAQQLKKRQNLNMEGALWAIWKTRNDLAFNDRIMHSPTVIIHKTIALLTQWKTLLRKSEQEKMELWIKKLEETC
ncbi:unnamed protein product [Urochloa humidicola]